MSPRSLTGLRVLIVDDDSVMRELLMLLFAAEGYNARSVDSGDSALSALHADAQFDVLLCDMQLPGLAGAALGNELRKAAPHTRLLGMSGSEPSPEDQAAFDGFLLKPFSPADFAAAVQTIDPSEAPRTGEASPSKEDWEIPALHEDTYARLAAALPAAALQEFYELTLTDVATRLNTMQQLVHAHDEVGYRREAHALKGGCSMAGATELAALAARAEAGSFGDTPAAVEFAAAAERLRSMMAARLTVKS